MDWFSISAVVVLAILMSGFIVMLGLNIVRNLRQGEKYRDVIEQRVNQLRLGAMAEHIGLSSRRLVHKVSAVDLHAQMVRCGGCEHTDACDKVLAEPATAKVDERASVVPGFCANSEPLEQLVGATPVSS